MIDVRRKEHKLLPVFLFKNQTATGEGFPVEWPFVLISKHVCAMLKDFQKSHYRITSCVFLASESFAFRVFVYVAFSEYILIYSDLSKHNDRNIGMTASFNST